jgi:hypothetical protein
VFCLCFYGVVPHFFFWPSKLIWGLQSLKQNLFKNFPVHIISTTPREDTWYVQFDFQSFEKFQKFRGPRPVRSSIIFISRRFGFNLQAPKKHLLTQLWQHFEN